MSDNTCQDVIFVSNEAGCELPIGFELYATMAGVILTLLIIIYLEIRIWKGKKDK